MKTKLFFISMMLFWGTMSELPIWGENNQFWGANNKYAMDASMLPTGAKAGLSIVPESLRVVGIRRSKLRHVWDPQDLTWDFDYSPDGRFLVIGGAGLTEDIRLFNAENLEFIGSGLYWYRIHSVTFRPDGRTIAGVTLDGRVHLIDRASLGIVSTLPGNAVIPIAWLSPDLSTLATERGDTDTSVLHWSDVRGNFTQTVRRQKETNDGYAVILSVGFDSSASTLASANQEGIIHLWDTGSGEHLQKFTQYRTDYDDELYCPTEVYEVNVGDRFGGREYWRTEDPNLNPPRPDRYVMIAAHDHWHDSPESAEALKKIIHIHETTYKFEGSHNTLCGVSDWVGVDQPVKRLIGHEDTIWNVVYSTDRPQIASASYDDTIRIWNVNVKRGFQKEVFTSHTLRFSNIAFGRDGEVMAVGKIDGTIRLHVGDRWWHSFKAHAGPVTSVAFHPAWKSYTVPLINGESVEVSVTPTLASAGTDGRVRFWHLHMDTERVSPRTDPWVFYSKPLGSKEDFTRVSSLFAPSIDVGAVVTSVAFSPDGNTFAFGSWEGVKVLKLWNPPGRDELPTFYLFGSTESIPFRPSQPVMSVAYSPDGDTLAAGCLDGSIVLEDVREAMWTFNIGTLRGHKAGVFKVAFSSDGRTLASGSDDGTVLLWNHRPKRTSRLPFTIAGSDPSEPDVNNEPASMPEVDPEAPNTSIEPSRIEIRGSSTRSGTVNTELDAPLLVRVLDANGDVVEDASVIFRVQTGHGRLSQSGNRRTLSVDTDSRGLAQASYTPLSDSSTVSASVGGVSEGVTFTITATDAATPPTPDTGINLIVPVDAAKRPLMIWIDGGAIYALMDTGVQALAPSVENVMNIAISGNKLYYTQMTGENTGTINSVNLNGTGAKQLVEIRAVPRGIAVDPVAKRLYWTNSQGWIQSSNLEGTARKNIVSGGLENPMGITVSDGWAYWTQGNGRIKAVNLTGTKTIRNISTGTNPANGVAVFEGKVYWTAMTGKNAGTINSANLDGTSAKQLVLIQAVPRGIAVDPVAKRLYWTNSQGWIQSSNLEGTARRNVANGLGSPGGIALSANIKAPATKSTTTAANKYDVNGDGSVDIKDVTALTDAISLGVTASKYDVNGDGKVDLLDAVAVNANLDAGAAGAPTRFGMKWSAVQIERLQEQIDLLIATGDRSPSTMKLLIYLQQLIVMARPEKTQLLANYPNPFNPETWIPYELATDTDVRLTIYNAQGVVVRVLHLGQQSAGYYTDRERAAYWDGRNALGEQVASGVYFYQLETDEMSSLRKMVILK